MTTSERTAICRVRAGRMPLRPSSGWKVVLRTLHRRGYVRLGKSGRYGLTRLGSRAARTCGRRH